MKTKMSQSSLIAYWSMRDAGELPDKERLVYYALALHGKMTREQIAARTGMKEGSACGRVNKLLERGILVVVDTIINKVTGKPNEVVDLVAARRAAHVPLKRSTPCINPAQMVLM
jgi:DNA-binding Lrp family transcriptional regulator